MTFLELLELEKEALLNPHYQYKDLTQIERDDLAKLSFARLTIQDQNLISTSWRTYCDKHKITFDLKDAVRLRFLAQTNLFFICKFLEKYSSVTINTHEEICNDFFVSKDPAHFKTFEDFAKSYNGFKERLLLVPRGGFKSSIDIADCVQWIICFPEVTILILTGVYKLATDFVGELREHFTLGETGEIRNDKPVYGPKTMNDGNQSLFQVLFPEHCVKPGGAATEFQTPACKMPDKEPTVMSASIEQSLSGWHFGIMKLDDVVTNENSMTLTRMETVNRQASINKAMLHPFGFVDKIGTWYHECLVGDTLITLSDWTQKPIRDIKVGDEVVGWNNNIFKSKRIDKNAPSSRNCFVKTKVIGVGKKESVPVNKYTFKSGRTIIATEDHNWLHRKGYYTKIGLEYNRMKYVRRVFIPTDFKNDCRWLAGVYDGEGSFQKNEGYTSGSITISQTTHNQNVVDEIRKQLTNLGFDFSEKFYNIEKENHSDKYEFTIKGGFQARYRFLTEVNPIRKKKIVDSLYGQLQTFDDKLISVEPVGNQDVYYFQTTTGNYLADGCCSKNCDLYGCDLKYEKQLTEQGESPSMLVYLKAAWYPTEQAKKEGKIEENMKESDWILWFPERLPYKFLIKEKKKDPEGFAIKYLNDPTLVHQVKFPRELLIQRTVNASTLPNIGMIVSTWDTAYSTKSFADYTVGITSLIYGGRFYIIDMVRGRFNEYELPRMIAESGYKWKPKRIAIEDSMGVRWINREIRREMDRLGISIPVEFVPLGAGNKAHSKEMKAKPVLRLLGDERLYFSNSCAGLEELYAELEKFPNGTHDDIVSALSILVDQYAAYADMDSRVNFVRQDYVADQKSKDMHDRIYCLGRYATLTENNIMDMSFNKQQELGQVAQAVDSDPLSELLA